ncbi:MAG: Coenzyme F420 hydrogenase/dehydrogenase, beta subunit C-terminal domain [Syntrophales bacterium]|nr:Coenzyme F420 hydrogenase/dehydrogenase, beta subunit C-terminal domain [Syntrophales bacterium]
MEDKVVSKGQQALREKVLDAGLCTGCGACVDLCPYFRSHRGKTAALFPCAIEEGRCFASCPRIEVDMDYLSQFIFDTSYEGSPLGIIKSAVMAKAGPGMKPFESQAGGSVSSIMYYALKQGLIEGAVVTGRNDLLPAPRFVTDPEDVLACATSKYTAAPTLSAVNKAVRRGYENIGMVGTPCQVLASALMRSNSLKKGDFKDPFGLVVGLFCTWAMDFRLFEPFLSMRIDTGSIKKIDIPPPPAEILEVFSDNGMRLEFALDDIRKFVPGGCSCCLDMTAEFSDISVGVVEGIPGMNIIIIRTDRGKRIFEGAVSGGYLEVSELPDESMARLAIAAKNKKKRALSRAIEMGIVDSTGEKLLASLRISPHVLKRLTA